jgi:hypothetical protein
MSIIGLILGLVLANTFVVETKTKLMEKRFLETIEVALPQIKEECVKDAMDGLKERLSNNTYDFFNNELFGAAHGINVNSSKSKLIIEIALDDPQSITPQQSSIKKLEFDIHVNPDIVIDKVEKSYRELFKSKSASFVKYQRYGTISDEKSINEIHNKYQNLYDFSAIEKKYNLRLSGVPFQAIFYFIILSGAMVFSAYWISWLVDIYYAAKLNQHMVTGGVIAHN